MSPSPSHTDAGGVLSGTDAGGVLSHTDAGGVLSHTDAGGVLSHTDATGAARMVDVTDKAVTARTATATGTFRTTAEVVGLISSDGLPKGDALATARIAGIMAAKRTPDLVPMCHPLAITGVTLDLVLGASTVDVTATVRTTGRTGVEMEALTAVAVAGLTLHDMVKAVDPAAVMDGVRVTAKSGGKSGAWTREEEQR